MPLTPPPPPQKPPSNKKKHKPTQQELIHRFVQFWTNNGYASLAGQWANIVQAAGAHNLDPIYLAGLLMKKYGRIGSDYDRMEQIALAETKRMGKQGVNKAVVQFVQGTPNFKQYTPSYKGAWGPAEQAAQERKRFHEKLTGANQPMPFKDKWGRVITREQYATEVASLNDLFQQYLGRNMTKQEARRFVSNYWTGTKIARDYLTKLPGFYKGKAGTVWADSAPSFVTAWEDVYGVDKTLRPPKALIREAILRGKAGNDWFQDQIRKLPQYKKSTEYKGLFADFSTQYNQIIGQVDADGQKLIDDAIMKRQKPQEFIAELRKSPKYVTGIEQRSLVERDANAAGIYMPWQEKAQPEPTTPEPPTPEPPTPVDTRKPRGQKGLVNPMPPYRVMPGTPKLPKPKPKPKRKPPPRRPLNTRGGV